MIGRRGIRTGPPRPERGPRAYMPFQSIPKIGVTMGNPAPEPYLQSFRVIGYDLSGDVELILGCGHRKTLPRRQVPRGNGAVVTCMECWWSSLEPAAKRLRALVEGKRK